MGAEVGVGRAGGRGFVGWVGNADTIGEFV